MIQLYHTALLEVQIFPTQVYPLAELSQVLQGMLSWSMGFNFQLASSPVLFDHSVGFTITLCMIEKSIQR